MESVFLPGLLCDGHIWARQVADLADVTSASIADLTVDDSIGAMAERVLATAPDRFALVALSMGGYVAFEILRRAPNRVLALALFDTSASPDSPERASQRRAGLDSLHHGRFAGVTNRLLPELIHQSLLGGPVGQEVKDMAARVGGEAFARQQQAILDRPDSRPLLQSLDMPALVAVGDSDVLTPPGEALALHIGLRNSQFRLIRDCGHLPPLERPDETSAMLAAFLSSL